MNQETNELLSTSPLYIAGGNDLHTHNLLSNSNMTAAGSSVTKKTTIIINGSGNAFDNTTGNNNYDEHIR